MANIIQPVKHAFLRTISVICVLAVLALVGLGVKRLLYPKPTESYSQQVQSGGRNYNIENNPKPGEIADVVQDQVKKQKKHWFVGFIIAGVEVGIGK